MYIFALHSREFAPNNAGGTQVYFDDVQAGVKQEDGYSVVFQNDFEEQATIQDIPFTYPLVL